MGGRPNPNFKLIIESSSLDHNLILYLRDVRVRVVPAGPNRKRQDQCVQVRGIVRATGSLETRATLALASNGMELSNAIRLETKPFEKGDKDRERYVFNGGKAGRRSRHNDRAISKMLSQEAPEPLSREGGGGGGVRQGLQSDRREGGDLEEDQTGEG